MIDDDHALAPGQMRKSEFLAALRGSVCAAAAEALAGTIWSAAGCPWIDHWFDYYGSRDSTQIERAIQRYAPETVSAQSAADYIPLVAARVRRGIKEWSGSGKAPELPDLPMGAAAARVPPAVSRKEQPAGDSNPPVSPAAVRSELGPGVPLDSSVRTRLGAAAGQDLSQVRVHTDSTGSALSQSLNARAFAVGEHVAFAAGEYRPGTLAGDALIAHELAHVGQQQAAPAATQRARTADLESEADAAAARTVAGLVAGGAPRPQAPATRTGLRLSRCGGPAPEKIPMGMTKQQYWRKQFKEQIPQLENIGKVDGPRDDGVATEVGNGLRVPKHKGCMLNPRRFYEIKEAEMSVFQGYVHYAELIEAGLGQSAVNLSMAYGAPFIPDNKLNLYQFVGWAERAELARRGVEFFIAASDTANTYGEMAADRAAIRQAEQGKPVIVKGQKGDPVVDKATKNMAKRTGQRVVKLGKGVLEGRDEVTIVAHGHETVVKIGDELLTPEELAQALVDSGWEGGTVRLATCKGAVCDPASGKIYAQELSKELNALGKDSAVIGADNKVAIPRADRPGGGVPRVRNKPNPAGKTGAEKQGLTLQAPGKGWDIYVE